MFILIGCFWVNWFLSQESSKIGLSFVCQQECTMFCTYEYLISASDWVPPSPQISRLSSTLFCTWTCRRRLIKKQKCSNLRRTFRNSSGQTDADGRGFFMNAGGSWWLPLLSIPLTDQRDCKIFSLVRRLEQQMRIGNYCSDYHVLFEDIVQRTRKIERFRIELIKNSFTE